MTAPVDWRRLVEATLGVPATEGNDVEVLRNGDQIFPAMLDAIRDAERSVDLLTFVYWRGEIAETFADELSAAARRGVRTRVLLDAVGARLLDDELVERMVEAGCDVRWFRPVSKAEIGDVDHRTHRKVLVVDERIGFTGGVGIADEWTGDARNENEWRDTHLRIVGPCVDGLRAAFVDNWFETDGDEPWFDPEFDRCPAVPPVGDCRIQVVRGAAGAGHTAIATLVRLLLDRARTSVQISVAYFTPCEVVERSLLDALERGVTVDIVVPGPHADKRFMRTASEATFDRLLAAGARIHVFQPTMFHAKIVIIDGEIATVGSANFDNRAVSHDDEVNVVLLDPGPVRILAEHFADDVARSEPVDPAEWADRGMLQRVREALVGVVADVL